MPLLLLMLIGLVATGPSRRRPRPTKRGRQAVDWREVRRVVLLVVAQVTWVVGALLLLEGSVAGAVAVAGWVLMNVDVERVRERRAGRRGDVR